MTIANVIVRGGQAHLYNEKGSNLKIINLASGTLVGFTPTTISVKRGGRIFIYDEKGHQTGSMNAK